MVDSAYLWSFFPLGYLITILIETPILLIGLSKQHSLPVRFFSGVGLTAFTYPIVVLVLPILLLPYGQVMYLTVAEIFAPVAECLLFLSVFGNNASDKNTRVSYRDCGAIILANVASFLIGMWLFG